MSDLKGNIKSVSGTVNKIMRDKLIRLRGKYSVMVKVQ